MKILNINTTPGILSISNPNPRLQMDISHPKIEMNPELSRIEIDQQQCFNESGLMDYKTLTDQYAAEGKQAVFSGIARRVSEGNMLANIAGGGNAIAEIARSNSFDNNEYDIDIAPKSRPTIQVIEGHLDIRVEEGHVSMNGERIPVEISYQSGKVDISI